MSETIKKCDPKIIYAVEHRISPSLLPENVANIVKRLYDGGFQAYLVGGGVRDLLLGKHPKDFDIVTNALPKEIKHIFGAQCCLIGRRFKLAHIYVNRQIFEVSTFRTIHQEGETRREGIVVRDNQYGTIDEDAYRRDFTINGLYYDLQENTLLDFTEGLQDLKNRILRVIGDPETRYREDPVRMLRAVRFIAKIGLSPAFSTKRAILKLKFLLHNISPARLYEETLKLLQCGFAIKVVPLLEYYGLFEHLFLGSGIYLKKEDYRQWIEHLCRSTDQRVQSQKTVMSAFLFTAVLWPIFLQNVERVRKKGLSQMQAVEFVSKELIHKQMKKTLLPLWIRTTMRDIWVLTYRLEKRESRYAYKLLSHTRFRAAYDLLCLHAQSVPEIEPIVTWWNQFKTSDDTQKRKMLNALLGTSKQGLKKTATLSQ